MNSKEIDHEIYSLKKEIDKYVLISNNLSVFKKNRILHCKNIGKLLDQSTKLVKHLDDKYKEKLSDLNFFYVDNCKGPEIKVNPNIFGTKINL